MSVVSEDSNTEIFECNTPAINDIEFRKIH